MKLSGIAIKSQLHEIHVAWRRWRLLRSFMDTGVGCGNCASPTTTITALQKMEQKGLVTLTDDQVIWRWPD